MKFFKENISTILTNIICFGEPQIVEGYGKQWGLKQIKQTFQACEFSFPANKDLFEFLYFCRKEIDYFDVSYNVRIVIVLESGKFWQEEFDFYEDSDETSVEEYKELVKVFDDMKEYYKND